MVQRSGYPHGKKPWIRRESCVHFQRTVVSDHLDFVFGLTVVLVGLGVAVLVLLAPG